MNLNLPRSLLYLLCTRPPLPTVVGGASLSLPGSAALRFCPGRGGMGTLRRSSLPSCASARALQRVPASFFCFWGSRGGVLVSGVSSSEIATPRRLRFFARFSPGDLLLAVKLLSGPSLAFSGVLSGPRSFLTNFYSGFKRFLHIQLSFYFLARLSGNF